MEQYNIAKLKLFNEDKFVYVAILKLSGSKAKVKCLKQPLYILSTSKYANSIFDGYDSEYDYEEVALCYENRTHTFIVHVDMLQPIGKNELYSIMKHLIYVEFLDKNNIDELVNKKIYSEALERLYFN